MVEQGSLNVVVAEPTPDMGENRYLIHFTSEIFQDGEPVGYVLFTKYSYQKVMEDKIPFKWLVQPHSYMSMVGDLIVGTESRYPDLPLPVSEVIDDHHGHVYIIDEVTCNRSGLNKKSHLEALSIVVSVLKDQGDAILVADAEPFSRYLSDMKMTPANFWGQYGIQSVEGRYLYSKYITEDFDVILEHTFPEPF